MHLWGGSGSLTRSGVGSVEDEAAASVGADWLQAAWTCSAGGGDGVDEGVAAFEAGHSATSSSFPGASALESQKQTPWAIHAESMRVEGDILFAQSKEYLDSDDAAGAEQAAAVTGSGFPMGAAEGFTCSALFASLLVGCESSKSFI